ncbi:unnamed protein product [Clonostachys byssicola]|uniref:ATP-dependent bile acid permease n=1 Tax=Clonostachys byssicola TaxID=160290 RepID=A0A9N9TUX4_9HYPO|nr:unnamed protein product [Clonostachys byssicola]
MDHLGLTIAAFAVSVLSALPAATALIVQLREGKPRNRFYEDADGTATPEALARFSNRGVKAAIVFFSLCGVGSSTAILVRSSFIEQGNQWLLEYGFVIGAWASIFLHGVCIAAHHSSVKSHILGIWLWVSALSLMASSIARLMQLSPKPHGHVNPLAMLDAVNIVASCVVCLLSVMLPRRPDVLHNGCKVDRQSTVSFISKYSWSWVEPLLRLAIAKGDLDYADVPGPNHSLRASELQNSWIRFGFQSTSLFESIIWAHKGKIALLWTISSLKGAMSILPYWSMLSIITLLESDENRSSYIIRLLLLVGIMTFTNLLDAWMDGWAYWYSVADLSLPIRSQMASLVFDKSLRRKDVKTATKEAEDRSERESKPQAEETDATDKETVLKSRQAIVNLVGVDLNRISQFLQFHFLIINGVVKLALFSVFLVRLIGWIPFIAGMLAWLLTLPANAWFSKKVLEESDSLMKLRDRKLSKVSEALLGMRQIKFSALEAEWEQRISAARQAELRALWRYFLADSAVFGCWAVSPILLAATCLTVYVFINGRLTPSVAFVSIGVFNSLEITLVALPELITLGIESFVSAKRLGAYLNGPERRDILTNSHTVGFERAMISWPTEQRITSEDRFTLSELNLSFLTGELSIISGKTGSGKSLLISALIGEADLIEGFINVPKRPGTACEEDEYHQYDSWVIPGSVAYIGQNPWLENGSLRDNVLFGLPFLKSRYDAVIVACALRDDLTILPDGDSTELGANGVNLSGGQKWRVTLARAIYSRADILIMDDVFSAVDTHVGRWILDKCLTGPLCQSRTRILVTHASGLVLSAASYIVELSDGRVKYAGPPHEPLISSASSSDSEDSYSPSATVIGEGSVLGNLEDEPATPSPSIPPEDSKKFFQEEVREKGTVKSRIYLTYLKSCGGMIMWFVWAGVFFSHEISIVARGWWLRIWTAATSSQTIHQNGNILGALDFMQQQTSPQRLSELAVDDKVSYYLSIYLSISVAASILALLRFFLAYAIAIKGSKAIFDRMLFRVLRAPLRWLDTVPIGRVINRFTADMHTIDERLMMSWGLFYMSALRLIGVCVATLFASRSLILPALVLVGIGAITGGRYLTASRPLKRLESNAKSPVFELFNTTLTGISTIRAFQRSQSYLTQMQNNLDKWVMTSFYLALANRWMSFRMALIAAVFCIAVGLVIVFNHSIDAALAGFALSFILDFSESIRYAIRYYGDMELDMNAMERATEYMELDTEDLSGYEPPAAWPRSGNMEFSGLEVAYAADLPSVLSNLTFSVAHNERVGVVGRTGAGKSSLTLALFRFLDTRAGSIIVDGLDISKIAVQTLRSRLSIIPQDPVLFSGTVRSNLDPFGHHTDEALFDALIKVQLVDSDLIEYGASIASAYKNVNIFHDLSSPISESGGNLSQGQRQLLCIARAIVNRPKIIVLDEATSAVDAATDTLIQQSIRQGFGDSTLLVIAHRLGTVADFDKILVLDKGRMAEFGTPRELWEKEGIFRGMCENTSVGEKEKLKASIFS